VSPRVDLPKRIIEYAQKTRINFDSSGRLSSWLPQGLPDLRGFCPHLRTVNLYEDQKKFAKLPSLKKAVDKEIKSGNPGPALWILHDILHIAFYDFATLHLGEKSWTVKERFLENHLASELFSVLCLDYHFLIYTKTKGLAVHLDAKKWPKLQKANLNLPQLGTFDYCQHLFELYFTGHSPLIFGRNYSEEYKAWIDHEVRYAKKQRRYVQQWWDDLQSNPDSGVEANLEGSQVVYGVWELIENFTKADKETWDSYLKEIRESQNLFNSLKKYNGLNRERDFRFTDIRSLERSEIVDAVKRAKEPSASGLFLFWQILATFDPARFDRRTRTDFAKLAQIANEKTPSADLWSRVQSVVQTSVSGPFFRFGSPQKEKRGTFFLP
jgi:hypothetical protein